MGKKKPSKVKPSLASSVFDGIDNFNVTLDGFASSDTTRDPGKKFQTLSRLDSSLVPLKEASTKGLANNQSFLNVDPAQQLSLLRSGNNELFNALNLQNQRNAETLFDQLDARFASNGLQNSSVRGALAAQLAGEQQQLDLNTQLQALQFQRENAINAINANQGILGGLAQLTQFPAQLSNQSALTGFQNRDQVALANAQAINQARQFNANAENQFKLSGGSTLGSLLGAGASIAGAALGGPIGGAIGKGVGGLFSRAIGGGGGGGAIGGLVNAAPSSFSLGPVSAFGGFGGARPGVNLFGQSAFTGNTFGLGA